jgi:hypothetical protein
MVRGNLMLNEPDAPNILGSVPTSAIVNDNAKWLLVVTIVIVTLLIFRDRWLLSRNSVHRSDPAIIPIFLIGVLLVFAALTVVGDKNLSGVFGGLGTMIGYFIGTRKKGESFAGDGADRVAIDRVPNAREQLTSDPRSPTHTPVLDPRNSSRPLAGDTPKLTTEPRT